MEENSEIRKCESNKRLSPNQSGHRYLKVTLMLFLIWYVCVNVSFTGTGTNGYTVPRALVLTVTFLNRSSSSTHVNATVSGTESGFVLTFTPETESHALSAVTT